ncbi:hypothetical protein VNO77_23326 [Canavalia gladiata]|uniref:Uncharacterized protein n=1 Tax=Canavalia gladiata TaxID=3824 RepID=A0AAN9L529_CANGL
MWRSTQRGILPQNFQPLVFTHGIVSRKNNNVPIVVQFIAPVIASHGCARYTVDGIIRIGEGHDNMRKAARLHVSQRLCLVQEDSDGVGCLYGFSNIEMSSPAATNHVGTIQNSPTTKTQLTISKEETDLASIMDLVLNANQIALELTPELNNYLTEASDPPTIWYAEFNETPFIRGILVTEVKNHCRNQADQIMSHWNAASELPQGGAKQFDAIPCRDMQNNGVKRNMGSTSEACSK